MLAKFSHPREQADSVHPSERITRYIFSKRHYSETNNRIKHAAFMPSPKGEVSVYRTDKLDDNEIWNIGEQYVATPPKRTIKARADILASIITKQKVCINPDTRPHPLHANIVDWPKEPDEQKQRAIEMANRSDLYLP